LTSFAIIEDQLHHAEKSIPCILLLASQIRLLRHLQNLNKKSPNDFEQLGLFLWFLFKV